LLSNDTRAGSSNTRLIGDVAERSLPEKSSRANLP
jgi:hypothetical protein